MTNIETITSEIGTHCANLCDENWATIEKAISQAKDGKAKVSLSVDITPQSGGHQVHVKFSVGMRYTDECDSFVDDPEQEKFEFTEVQS